MPATVMRQTYRGKDVVETLKRGAAAFGYPPKTLNPLKLAHAKPSLL